MPSASVLFYGRRSRSSRTFDDLGGASTSSDPPSSSTTNTHRHRQSPDPHPHRRRRHTNPADPSPPPLRSPSHAPAPSALSPLPGSEPHQRGCDSDLTSLDVDQDSVQHVSRRYSRNNRLPGPVLLAKERLLQRLQSVSVSGGRPRRDRSPSLHSEDFWVVDADWETGVFGEQPAADPNLTETQAEEHQLSTPQEPNKKPMGLSNETLSKLHHENFQEHQIDCSHLASEASTDCSICLENFTEGNKLMGLPCGHRFHSSCLYPWLLICGECPYCRRRISPSPSLEEISTV